MYKESKTMFILGEQVHSKYISPEVSRQINEVMAANIAGRGGSDLLMLLQDVYILGHINGVHDERSRRNGRKRVV